MKNKFSDIMSGVSIFGSLSAFVSAFVETKGSQKIQLDARTMLLFLLALLTTCIAFALKRSAVDAEDDNIFEEHDTSHPLSKGLIVLFILIPICSFFLAFFCTIAPRFNWTIQPEMLQLKELIFEHFLPFHKEEFDLEAFASSYYWGLGAFSGVWIIIGIFSISMTIVYIASERDWIFSFFILAILFVCCIVFFVLCWGEYGICYIIYSMLFEITGPEVICAINFLLNFICSIIVAAVLVGKIME